MPPQNDRRHVCVWVSLMAAAVWASVPSAARGDVLYATGFEPPAFAAGPLDGQGGFVVAPTSNPDPFTVTTTGPYSGAQDVAVSGASLTGAPDFVQSTAALTLNYDAIAAGRPVVTIEAHVLLNGPSTNTGGGTGDDLASINLEALTGSFNPSTFAGYDSTYLSSDGQAYGFTTGYFPHSATVTLGQYHDLMLILDFAARTATFAVDGSTLGTAAFDPADTSDVLSAVQFTMYSYVIPGTVDPAAYTARIDDLMITAVPEPSSLVLATAGLGLAGLVARKKPKRARDARSG